MKKSKNISFEKFLPKTFINKSQPLSIKSFKGSIIKAKQNLKFKKNVLYSFSKNFKLNINLKDLKEFHKFKRVIIIGMGGSILGSEAVNDFLKYKTKKDIIFVNNLNFETIIKIKKIKNLKNSLFFLISKSGNTIEVLSIINALKSKAKFNKKNTLIITENKKNQLSQFGREFQIKTIYHRNYISGRYSVFSETALIPCYFMGVNTVKLRKNILNYLFKEKSTFFNNLVNLTKIYHSKKINSLILLNYCPGLERFLLWCQQLIAESLGKKGKGILPVISIGPRDHHSLLQLYLDGPKDKFFYIFSLNNKSKIKFEKNLFKNTLNNSNIYKVLNDQKNAMISILKKKEIPFISLELGKKNEETLGELFSYFILETIFIGENLNINPFNQPAVEELKRFTKLNLFKKSQK